MEKYRRCREALAGSLALRRCLSGFFRLVRMAVARELGPGESLMLIILSELIECICSVR